jgi:hypothetical protein
MIIKILLLTANHIFTDIYSYITLSYRGLLLFELRALEDDIFLPEHKHFTLHVVEEGAHRELFIFLGQIVLQ